MDNPGHTSRGDEGFGGRTKLSFIAQALRPGEVGEAGHSIPTLGSVMGKWKGIGGGWGSEVTKSEVEIRKGKCERMRSAG